jgi:hypothetical protein
MTMFTNLEDPLPVFRTSCKPKQLSDEEKEDHVEVDIYKKKLRCLLVASVILPRIYSALMEYCGDNEAQRCRPE